jgi:hypothetical protein
MSARNVPTIASIRCDRERQPDVGSVRVMRKPAASGERSERAANHHPDVDLRQNGVTVERRVRAFALRPIL